MSEDTHKTGYWKYLLTVFTGTIVVMLAYESLKQDLFGHLTMWQSHWITIFFTAFLAVLVSTAVIKFVLSAEKKTKMRLAEVAAQQEAILRSVGDGLVVADKQGKILFANDVFEKLLGLKLSDVRGKDVSTAIVKQKENGEPVDYKDYFIAKALRGDTYSIPPDSVYWFVRRDGTRFPTNITVSPVMFQGQIIGAVETFRDISFLYESQRRVEELAQRFAFATSSARIGVWDWDVVHNVLTWDDQMYALYGIKKGDFSGAYDAWQSGLHPDDKKRGDDEINLALEGKKDFNITFRVVWPNKEVHDIRAFASVERDAEGKPLKMVGVNWDVTKEMEVDKAKSEFVSLASHQLRTPLSTINWYAEMLESGDAGPLTEKQHEFLKEIYLGSQRMVGLVNALLNVSRLELGRLTVEPSLTDLPTLSKTIISELKPIIEKNQLTVTEQYGESLPLANVDPKLISIVFQNLLTNAVKYTEEKGVIIFSIEMRKAGESFGERTVEGDSYAISVKDSGIGIPENQQHAIFTKLFRADNARERDQDGTGLGLYIVKEIVDLAGGAVWYNSKKGTGTTFYVLLPVEGMTKSFGKTSLK